MVSIGLHTVVIQTTAWVSMLVQYSVETGSVVQAVADTFDGEHGCPLCELAQKAQQSPSDDNRVPDAGGDMKLHLIAESVPLIIITALPPPLFPAGDEAPGSVRPHSPDTPPPRWIVA